MAPSKKIGIKQRVGAGVAVSVVFCLKTLYRIFWKWPMWKKIVLVVVMVSAVSLELYFANVFKVDRGTLVGVLTLQSAFAGYLIAVTKEDHKQRLIPVIQQVLSVVVDEEQGLNDLAESVSIVTLYIPQRLAAYVLASDILMCPFIMLKSDYVQVWIVTMSFVNTTWLIFAFSLHRIELLDKWLTVRVKKFQAYMEKHGKEFLVGFIMLGFVFIASRLIQHPIASETFENAPATPENQKANA